MILSYRGSSRGEERKEITWRQEYDVRATNNGLRGGKITIIIIILLLFLLFNLTHVGAEENIIK